MSGTHGIKLDGETHNRLKALGEIRDRSPHWLMRTAILISLEKEERYEREKREDAERWDRYQLTDEAVPHERVAQWLGKLAQGEVAKPA